MLTLLIACAVAPETPVEAVAPTCAEAEAAFWAEADRIQACSTDEECGQPLAGTSCGCTRAWVARLDADPTAFYALQDDVVGACSEWFASTCDCPATDGFRCKEGTCAWNYVMSPFYEHLTPCAGRGDPYDLVGVALSGDTLSLDVTYTGGCRTHQWALCWPTREIAATKPPSVALTLLHDSHHDACEADVAETITVDLTPLREAYGHESGVIEVVVNRERVTYRF